MCNSPEAFLSLRSHFISSHALLCVSHWILGIGDRHLSNFMINMETGGMIGIDFGHAFGSATQVILVCCISNECWNISVGTKVVTWPIINKLYFLTVHLCAWAHAIPADTAVCESNATIEGVGFDPEHHGTLPPSLQSWARPFAEHHGCVRQGALAGLEGNQSLLPRKDPIKHCISDLSLCNKWTADYKALV